MFRKRKNKEALCSTKGGILTKKLCNPQFRIKVEGIEIQDSFTITIKYIVSIKYRKQICREIYILIKTSAHSKDGIANALIEQIKSGNPEWKEKIPLKDFNKVKNIINQPNFLEHFKSYLSELIAIIQELIGENERYKKDKISFNVSKFVNRLYQEEIRLGCKNKESMKGIIREIIDNLKISFDDFNLERITLQKLYDDGKKRECGRCNEIKAYTEFDNRTDTNTGAIKKSHICRECDLIKDMITKYRKKLKIMLNIYDGKLRGKCIECDTDIRRLSAIDLHHPDGSYKSIDFGKSKYRKNYDVLIRLLELENPIILCANCHSPKQSKIFNRYSNQIMKYDLFELSGQEIYKIVRNEVFRRVKKYRHQEIQRVYHWIKKRYMVEKVYNGKCIGCGLSLNKNNLPIFDRHLPSNNNVNASEYKWEKLKKYDIPTIFNILKERQIVFLCSNCHRMIRNEDFIQHLDEIYEGDLAKYIPIIKKDYNSIINNINKFYFPKIEINDVLARETIRDIWKIVLIGLYKHLSKKENFQFDRHLVEDLLNCKETTAQWRINKLRNLGYVEMIKKGGVGIPAIYILTNDGIKKAIKLNQNESV